MFLFDFTSLHKLLEDIIKKNVSAETFVWLTDRAVNVQDTNKLYSTFGALPRRTGKSTITVDAVTRAALENTRKGLNIYDWSIDRLTRVWLIMHIDPSDRDAYFKKIETLFQNAEVNELVALYSALPVLAYPDLWKARCAEGIRNNIADVLTAIMCNNPYPSENLDEAAWNQMVLKAFFTEKPVEQIVGLDRRANARLASTLSDYAHERWAAHRTVNPQLWRCVGPFIDETIFPDIQKIAASENELEQEAAALASNVSNYAPAKDLIPDRLFDDMKSGRLTWDTLAKKTGNYVLQ